MIIKLLLEPGTHTQGDKKNNRKAKRTKFGETTEKIQAKKSDFALKWQILLLKNFRLKYRPINKSK